MDGVINLSGNIAGIYGVVVNRRREKPGTSGLMFTCLNPNRTGVREDSQVPGFAQFLTLVSQGPRLLICRCLQEQFSMAGSVLNGPRAARPCNLT